MFFFVDLFILLMRVHARLMNDLRDRRVNTVRLYCRTTTKPLSVSCYFLLLSPRGHMHKSNEHDQNQNRNSEWTAGSCAPREYRTPMRDRHSMKRNVFAEGESPVAHGGIPFQVFRGQAVSVKPGNQFRFLRLGRPLGPQRRLRSCLIR